MAPSEREASAIADAAERNGVMLAVCHVLRYTPYTRTLKRLLDERPDRPARQRPAPGAGRLVAPRALVRPRQLAPPGRPRRPCCWPSPATTSTGSSTCSASPAPGQLLRQPDPLPARRAPGRGGRPLPRLPARTDLPVLGEAALPRLPRRSRARDFWPLGAVTEDLTEAGVLEALRTGPVRPLRLRLRQRRRRPPGGQPWSSPTERPARSP